MKTDQMVEISGMTKLLVVTMGKVYILNQQVNHKRQVKGSVQRESRRVWSNISTRYLVWGCGDGCSFIL